MAGTPRFKIYNPSGQYVASTKHAEDAACLMALYGNGATVKLEHKRIIWSEGSEKINAGESYDTAASIMYDRI